VLLLLGNACFVAAGFAHTAVSRHRLEQAAAGGSRGARAALVVMGRLSLTLAGAQLGITLCTLGLGALAVPLLGDLVESPGLPTMVAYTVALALIVLVHTLVGEMAARSWAASDPQRSAIALARPFHAFIRFAEPAIRALNRLANVTLRLVKVLPQDDPAANAHGPDDLRMLLYTSRRRGLLPVHNHQLLSRLLRLRDIRLSDVMTSGRDLVTVATTASAAEVERISRISGRSRLLVLDDAGQIAGVVHVRDALRATTASRPATAAELMTEPFSLPADRTVLAAIHDLRESTVQLAIVRQGVRPVGVVSLEDLVEEVIGDFDDETDQPGTASSDALVGPRGPVSQDEGDQDQAQDGRAAVRHQRR
jgi:CBS domain containing-hemolysin-like protein